MSFWLILLITFFLVRYVLPTVLRALLGSFVRQQVHKAQNQAGASFGNGPFGPPPPRPTGPAPAPGQVRVEYVPPTAARPSHGSDRVGEYVDFEEV